MLTAGTCTIEFNFYFHKNWLVDNIRLGLDTEITGCGSAPDPDSGFGQGDGMMVAGYYAGDIL